MKFLCICQYGHSRSVALARVLHGRGHQAVPVGAGTSPAAIPLLADWADHIVIVQPQFLSAVPAAYHKRTKLFDVGRDRWSNPYNTELLDIFTKMVVTEGW